MNLRKNLIKVLFCIAVYGLSSSAFASYMIADEGRRWYFDIGAEGYQPKLSGFNAGVTSASTSQPVLTLQSKTPNDLLYKTAIGYKFTNACSCDSLLPKLFGRENAVELKLEHGDFNSSANANELGFSNLWFIDGSGSIWEIDHRSQTFDVKSSNLSHKQQMTNIGLYFKGNQYFGNISTRPAIGVVFNDLKDTETSATVYDGWDQHHLDLIKGTAKTQSYGLSVGDGIYWKVKPNIQPFINVEVQLLNTSTDLACHQDPIDPPTPHHKIPSKDIKDSLNKFTYRAIAAVGVEYRFSNNPSSWKMVLKGGIDRFGYNPNMALSTHKGEKSHLSTNAVTNQFFGLDLYVPIG